MVAHNRFEVKTSTKQDGIGFVRRAQVVDSIHNALAPYGFGKNGWRCEAYDDRGKLQEFHSEDSTKRHGDHGMSLNCVDEENSRDAYASTVSDSSNNFDFLSEDEFPARQPSRPRIRRTVRRHRRSLLPRDASLHSVAPYPLPVPASENASDVDDDPIPKKKQARVFEIQDTQRVTAFFVSRLKRMQQLADKKIAKAWIKGICPKKQAKFPYQNNRKDNPEGAKEKPLLPGWWPDPDTVCQFKEPDHIKRDERMRLCLHLLRLRPTPEQLRAWNQDKSEPHPTHVTQGWTAFLKELAGVEIFEDLPKEDKKRTQQKQNLMVQMYEVAQMEEDFERDEVDGEQTWTWEDDEEERKPPPMKRTRQLSFASDAARDSRASSVSFVGAKPKKARRQSLSDTSTIVPFKTDVDMLNDSAHERQQSMDRVSVNRTSIEFPSSRNSLVSVTKIDTVQPRQSIPYLPQYETVPMKRDTSMSSHATDDTIQWNMTTPETWGTFTNGGSQSGQFHTHGFQNQTTFPGRQDFEFPQFQQQQNMMQAHQGNQVQIQEPQFQTVPNAPVFPQSMPYMQTTSCEQPPAVTYATQMPASQYFMPASSDPPVTGFQSPTAYGARPNQHVAPMQQYQGWPQQGECGQQLYHHHGRG